MTDPAEPAQFVLRQFSLLAAEQGATPQSVAERLRAALPAKYQGACNDIEAMLTGQAASAGGDLALKRIVETTRKHGGNPLDAMISFRRVREEASSETGGFFLGLIDQGVYLAALAAVLLVVVGVYTIYVLPQFASLFDTFGATLPQFTRMMLDQRLLLWPMLGIFFIGTVAAWWAILRAKRHITNSQPFPASASWLPVVGDLLRTHNTLLWLRWLSIFLDAGLTYAHATEAASELGTRPAGGTALVDELSAADKLGTLREELAAQISRLNESQLRSLVRTRTLGLYALRGLIYFGVASMIVAMYLPIFKLGAII